MCLQVWHCLDCGLVRRKEASFGVLLIQLGLVGWVRLGLELGLVLGLGLV